MVNNHKQRCDKTNPVKSREVDFFHQIQKGRKLMKNIIKIKIQKNRYNLTQEGLSLKSAKKT